MSKALEIISLLINPAKHTGRSIAFYVDLRALR